VHRGPNSRLEGAGRTIGSPASEGGIERGSRLFLVPPLPSQSRVPANSSRVPANQPRAGPGHSIASPGHPSAHSSHSIHRPGRASASACPIQASERPGRWIRCARRPWERASHPSIRASQTDMDGFGAPVWPRARMGPWVRRQRPLHAGRDASRPSPSFDPWNPLLARLASRNEAQKAPVILSHNLLPFQNLDHS
jgi:hypothetical protein